MAESFDDGFADLPYIHEAAKRGHADQVKELVDTPEGKKDVNSTDPLGNTPLLWAVMGDHDECVKVLLGAGVFVLSLAVPVFLVLVSVVFLSPSLLVHVVMSEVCGEALFA